MQLILALAVGYILGAVPSGVAICRVLGKDPRQVGRGRTGGTNVYRTAGLRAAVLTVVSDVGKGALAAAAGARLAGGPGAWPLSSPEAALAASLAAVAAILGHNYSVFLGFRGGAGSAPNLGALLVFDPLVGLGSLAVSAAVLFTTGIASLASLVLAMLVVVGLVVRVLFSGAPPQALIYAAGQLLLVSWALRPNIKRLVAGSERRVSFGSGQDQPLSRTSVVRWTVATVVFVAIGVIDVRYGHTLALAVLIVIVVAIAVFGGSGHR